MKSLRNSCTGRWPVHSFQKTGGVAAALMLAAAPLASPRAAAAAVARRPSARGRPQSGQSVADFYRRAEGRAAVAVADGGRCRAAADRAAQQRRASMGSTPAQYHVAGAPGGARRGARAASARTSSAPTRQLSEAFAAYVARPAAAIRASASPMSIRSCGRRRRSPLAALLDAAARAVAQRLCAQHGLDAPDLRRASRGARRAQV